MGNLVKEVIRKGGGKAGGRTVRFRLLEVRVTRMPLGSVLWALPPQNNWAPGFFSTPPTSPKPLKPGSRKRLGKDFFFHWEQLLGQGCLVADPV